ncbi:MAG: class I SAM-dependent methyltransferase [Gammaproteobacteria bacterium]|nr:class I SAM-dependent methyltransferase [Gammaproteobacteria bacterium]
MSAREVVGSPKFVIIVSTNESIENLSQYRNKVVQMLDYKCISCESGKGKYWLRQCRDYYLQKLPITDYVICSNCSSCQQHPIPKDVSSYYDDYPIHKQKTRFTHYFRKMLFSKAMYSPSADSQDVLLDYGCGDGSYLMDVLGKVPTLVGFELNTEHAKSLSRMIGVPIYSDEKLLLDDWLGQINTITMNMVLEHLTNLESAFLLANKLLVNQGILYILVPNALSWESKLFKRKWHGLDAPRHVSFPSDGGIVALAKKSNFEVDQKYFVSYPTSIAGSISSLMINKFNYLLFLFFVPVSFILSRMFPSGSKVYVLRKVEGTRKNKRVRIGL